LQYNRRANATGVAMEGAALRVGSKANIPSVPGRHLMKNLKLPLGFFFAVGFVLCAAGPVLADSTAASNQPSAPSARNATPLTRIAACLPLGSSCDKGSDCCSANCAPQHHKCAR
jgi:hypothetical protein